MAGFFCISTGVLCYLLPKIRNVSSEHFYFLDSATGTL
jgi:hypothetical protein